MVNFRMAVNRYCMECIKRGEFLPLRFNMINLLSGMWMCPKDECVFPMDSSLLKDYMEDNMTTEKVLLLTNKGCSNKPRKKKRKFPLTKHKLDQSNDANDEMSKTSSKTSETSLTSPTTTTAITNSFTSSSLNLKQSKNSIIKYPLWSNEALLCWLDSAMSLIVLNKTFREHFKEEGVKSSVSFFSCLFDEYEKTLNLYSVKQSYRCVEKHLREMRTNVLIYLQPKLLVNYGDDDSPLFSLPLILKTDSKLYSNLEMEYLCHFSCEKCKFEKKDGFCKVILTIPNCSEDLDFNDNIFYNRFCYRCNEDNQITRCKIEKFPIVFFVHFSQGVRTKRFWEKWKFINKQDEEYVITQIVQYIHKKHHFVLWNYNYKGDQEKLWLLADDLYHPVSEYMYKHPRCPRSEVHMLVWEKVKILEIEDNFDRVKTSDSLEDITPPKITTSAHMSKVRRLNNYTSNPRHYSPFVPKSQHGDQSKNDAVQSQFPETDILDLKKNGLAEFVKFCADESEPAVTNFNEFLENGPKHSEANVKDSLFTDELEFSVSNRNDTQAASVNMNPDDFFVSATNGDDTPAASVDFNIDLFTSDDFRSGFTKDENGNLSMKTEIPMNDEFSLTNDTSIDNDRVIEDFLAASSTASSNENNYLEEMSDLNILDLLN